MKTIHVVLLLCAVALMLNGPGRAMADDCSENGGWGSDSNPQSDPPEVSGNLCVCPGDDDDDRRMVFTYLIGSAAPCDDIEFKIKTGETRNPTVAEVSSQGGCAGSARSRARVYHPNCNIAIQAKCKDGDCKGKKVYLGAARGPNTGATVGSLPTCTNAPLALCNS